MTRNGLVLALVAALLGGCHSYLTTEVQEPQVANLDGSRTEIAEAIVDLVRDNGWAVKDYNPAAGWIVATEPVDRSDGFVTRRRWQFSVRERGVATQSFLDYWDDGYWKATFLVCEGYDYTLERQMHKAIAHKLRPTELRHIAAVEQ